MKKIPVLLLLVIGCSTGLQAQTKRIAHRSHSGSNHTLVMTTEDNFGLPSKPKDTAVKKPAPAVNRKKIKHKKVTPVTRSAGR